MHLYRAGMPLVLLSEFLGHADINTTRIYAWADKVPPSHSPFLAIGRGEGTKPVGNHIKAPEAYAFRGFFPP